MRPIEERLSPREEKLPIAIEHGNRMLAAIEDERAVARVGGHADHFGHIPPLRPAGPVGDGPVAKIPGRNLVCANHSRYWACGDNASADGEGFEPPVPLRARQF